MCLFVRSFVVHYPLVQPLSTCIRSDSLLALPPPHTPQGWLLDQLLLQANSLSGYMSKSTFPGADHVNSSLWITASVQSNPQPPRVCCGGGTPFLLLLSRLPVDNASKTFIFPPKQSDPKLAPTPPTHPASVAWNPVLEGADGPLCLARC